MELNSYMEQGIHSIVRTVSAFYLNNGKGIRFMASFLPSAAKAARLRKNHEKDGLHVPPFLIASIASQCNLHCAGCYARADGICSERSAEEMTAEDWKRVLDEAEELGVSFILLAGGEPLLKRDIIELAAEHKGMVFPVFTNAVLMNDAYLDLFDDRRNLIPVISIEGSDIQTDLRRGEGVARKISSGMAELQKRGILFGVSVTVTNENVHTAVSEDYLNELRQKGCGAVFYVEYVPAEKGTEHLVLSAEDTQWLNSQTRRLKKIKKDMVILSFPGDERHMDGCLAAARGFFHISPGGGAEPCPFSPFSVMNLKNSSIRDVLESDFFEKVRLISKNAEEHNGGCTLFLHEEEVKNSAAGL